MSTPNTQDPAINQFDWQKNAGFTENNTDAPLETKIRSLLSLKGKTAIVTGAGAGIGFAVAEALAEAGASVALWYKTNADAVAKAEQLAQKHGVLCNAYQVDITNSSAVKTAIDAAVSDLSGRLDIFVANSGMVWLQGPVIDSSAEDFLNILDVNLISLRHCAIYTGTHFKRQKETGKDINGYPLLNYTTGSFIATSSILSQRQAWPQAAIPYGTIKAAMTCFCRGLAVEWVRFARVNIVSPGYIDTGILAPAPDSWHTVWSQKNPMGRIGKPHEIKGAYLYLASDASSYATGMDMVIDGGVSHGSMISNNIVALADMFLDDLDLENWMNF